MQFYNYGETIPSIDLYIPPSILEDVYVLTMFIQDLNNNDMDFVSLNKEGVVVKIKEGKRSDEIKDSNYFMVEIARLRDLIRALNNKIQQENYEEMTEEFFVFFDMLPKEIKEKLRIYIKKSEDYEH